MSEFRNVSVLQEDEDLAGDVRNGGGRGESVRRGCEADVRAKGKDQLPLQPERFAVVRFETPLRHSHRETPPLLHGLSANEQSQRHQ